MRRLSSLLLATCLALAVGLVVASCGGKGDGGGGGGDGATPAAAVEIAGAKLVPASAAVFVSVDTDFDSDQWQAAEALINRFPGGADAFQSIFEAAGREGLDLETDIKPAFGPETDIAILDLSGDLQSTENAPLVLLTKPKDAAKFEALLARGEDQAVFEVVEDGWYLVADNQAIIDQFRADAGTAPLADDAAYKAATESLSGGSFARLYVNGATVTQAFTEQLGAQLGDNPLLGGLNPATGSAKLISAAVSLSATDQGVRVEGNVKTEGAPAVLNYAAELPTLAPSGAIVFASFSNLRSGLEQLLDLVSKQEPDFAQQLGQLELALGLSVQNDVLPLFEGEEALSVRAGAPIPEITLFLSPPDPQKGVAVLDQMASLGALAGAGSEGGSSFSATSIDIGGVPAKKLDFGESFSLYYAVVGKNLVLTTAESGIAGLAGEASHLVDDPLFQEAKQAAGLPDESLGFVYVNVQEALTLVQGLGSLQDLGSGILGTGTSGSDVVSPDALDPETLANLRPIRYLLVSASGGDNVTTFSGFVGIE